MENATIKWWKMPKLARNCRFAGPGVMHGWLQTTTNSHESWSQRKTKADGNATVRSGGWFQTPPLFPSSIKVLGNYLKREWKFVQGFHSTLWLVSGHVNQTATSWGCFWVLYLCGGNNGVPSDSTSAKLSARSIRILNSTGFRSAQMSHCIFRELSVWDPCQERDCTAIIFFDGSSFSVCLQIVPRAIDFFIGFLCSLIEPL